MELDNIEASVRVNREKAQSKRNALKWMHKNVEKSVKNECVLCCCKGWNAGVKEEYDHCSRCCFVLQNFSPQKLAGIEAGVAVMGPKNEVDGSLWLQESINLVGTEQLVDGAEASMPMVDVVGDISLPEVRKMEIKGVKEGQNGPISDKIREWKEEGGLPDKREALNLDSEETAVLRHISLFRINSQGIIFRIFVKKEGVSEILIFVEGNKLKERVTSVHEALGHCSKKGTFDAVKRIYYSTNLKFRVNSILNSCVLCICYNIRKGVREKQSTLSSCMSGDVLQVDLLGPLPPSHGYKYVWCAIDGFDKTCYLQPVKSASAECMLGAFSKFFQEQGLWRVVKIDSRCLSTKGLDKQLLDKLQVQMSRSNNISRHQGNVERLLQTILVKLLKVLGSEADLAGWAVVLNRVCFLMNSQKVEALGGLSPNDVRFRRPPTFLPPLLHSSLEGCNEGFERMVRISDDIRNANFRSVIRNKSYQHVGETLKEGEIVWCRRQSFSRHNNKKLQNKVVEGFKVLQRVGTNLYKVENIE